MAKIDSAPTPTGSLETAIAHAWRLLSRRPALAAAQAREVLRSAPGHPEARLVLATALRLDGDSTAARELAAALVQERPAWGRARLELAQALGACGELAAALVAAREAARLEPGLATAQLAIGDLLAAAGDSSGAEAAYLLHVEQALDDPLLIQAADALQRNALDQAEPLLRERLRACPSDVAAIRMLAELGARLGRYAEAEELLARCLELAPGFTAARRNLAGVLHRQAKGVEALAEVERLMQADAEDAGHRTLQAAVLVTMGEYERAIAAYVALLDAYPGHPSLWLSYGHALKTVGRQADSVEAYTRCLAIAPRMGEAWWSLANLKTVRFDAAQVAAMRAALHAPGDLPPEDRLHLNYALGKALEDAGACDEAFAAYAAGATIQKANLGYVAADTTRQVARVAETFTVGLMREKAGQGAPNPDPIFVVGLPRSGSTLIEQILSSHPEVEGTMELPEIVALARRIGEAGGYPEGVAALDAGELQALGRRYLDRTRVQRKSGRRFFVDKMPNNWLHAGLIRLILPKAIIIDARRHPLATCFSAFKQHFARGQNFSYGLEDLGQYYRDYVGLMDHFERVEPGRILRVIYEDMVEDTEGQVRRLLDHCGLPFDPACLRFYETERAVRTASSEQVRQPIFREGLDQWRRFETHLDPLKAALGPALQEWRGKT